MGIRAKLGLAALALLALPFMAAQFIAGMEALLRGQQEAAIGATARAIASALSDRPALFERSPVAVDPQAEERRRIVALFAAADPAAAASLGNAYAPSEEVERLLQIMGDERRRLWVIDARSRVRGLSGSLGECAARSQSLGGWLRPVAALVVPTPRVSAGDESRSEERRVGKECRL